MNRKTARKLADGLTWARIWSVLPLTVFAWFELRWWFLGFYVAAALRTELDQRNWFDRNPEPDIKALLEMPGQGKTPPRV